MDFSGLKESGITKISSELWCEGDTKIQTYSVIEFYLYYNGGVAVRSMTMLRRSHSCRSSRAR